VFWFAAVVLCDLGKILKFSSFSIASGVIIQKRIIILSIKTVIAVFSLIRVEAVLPISTVWLESHGA